MRGYRLRTIVYCAASAASLALSFDARAATFTWNKSTGGTWSAAANWTPSGPPTGNDNALFNLSASYTVTLPASETITTLTVGTASTASVTFNAAGHSLSVGVAHFSGGTVNFNGGTLTNPNVANYIDVSDHLNVGTASAIITAGPLAVGSTAFGTLSVTAGTLNLALSFSPDTVIGTTTASGQVALDFGSVGTFNNTTEIEQVNGTSAGTLGVFHNSTLNTQSLQIGVTNNGFGDLQLGVGSTSGGSVTQAGNSALTIGGPTFNGGYSAIVDIANGTFTTGTGSILFDNGADVLIEANGVLRANSNVTINGLCVNSGSLNAGSNTTIRAQTTANLYDAADDIFLDNPCLDNEGGGISAGTLIVDSTGPSDAWVKTVIGETTTDSMTFGTTIVGAASVGSLQIGETTANLTNHGIAAGHFTTGSLLIGQSAGGSGTVSVLGSLTIGSATIGELGQGTLFLDSFSTTNVSGPIVIADGAASQGTLIVSGITTTSTAPNGGTATLNAAGQQITVGNAGLGTMLIGFANITLGTLQIGSISGGSGFVSQGAGTLASSVTASTIHIGNSGGGSGTYQMNAGTLNAGSIDITSNGTFIYNGGVINGAIGVNGGSFDLAGPLASGNVTVNYLPNSNVFLPRGNLVPLNGNGFGLFAGAGTLNNTGSLSGIGTLLSNETLVNNGTVSSSGGDLVIQAGATLSNGSAGLLRNAPVSNLRIQTSNFTNLGNVEVNAGGAIELDTGSLNIASGKNASLLGGVLAAPALNVNSGGTVQGYGQYTGNLTNSGTASFFGLMNIQGPLTNSAGGVIKVRNAPTLVFGPASNSGSIVVNSGGTIIFDTGLAGAIPSAPLGSPPVATGGIDGTGSISLEPGGSLLTSYVKQSSLALDGSPAGIAVATIRPRGQGGATSVVNSLNIPASAFGKLDLSDNQFIIDYSGASPINAARAEITQGFAGGSWTGNGITSSLAASIAGDPSQIHKTAIGYGEAGTLGVGSFGGIPVDTSSLLIRYTFQADANLDGIVNTSDFTLLASHFNHTGAIWTDGDFNYDGVVNALDFNALATNFGQSISSPALSLLVPEPAAIVCTAFACVALARRRRGDRANTHARKQM